MKIITIALLFQFLLSCWPNVNIITYLWFILVCVISSEKCLGTSYRNGAVRLGLFNILLAMPAPSEIFSDVKQSHAIWPLQCST